MVGVGCNLPSQKVASAMLTLRLLELRRHAEDNDVPMLLAEENNKKADIHSLKPRSDYNNHFLVKQLGAVVVLGLLLVFLVDSRNKTLMN